MPSLSALVALVQQQVVLETTETIQPFHQLLQLVVDRVVDTTFHSQPMEPVVMVVLVVVEETATTSLIAVVVLVILLLLHHHKVTMVEIM